MTHFQVHRGLDIPISGECRYSTIKNSFWDNVYKEIIPQFFAIDFRPYRGVSFHLLAQKGDVVAASDKVVQCKEHPHIFLIAPCTSRLTEIRTDSEGCLIEIVLQREEKNQRFFEKNIQAQSSISSDNIAAILCASGLLCRFYSRPFHKPVMSIDEKKPKSCFIRAINLRPMTPSMDITLHEAKNFFSKGVEIVSRFLPCPIHLIFEEGSALQQHLSSNHLASHVEVHTISGPYPACSSSLHIQLLDPIQTQQDTIWVIDGTDVARIGYFFETGSIELAMLFSRSGEPIESSRRQIIKTVEGASIHEMLHDAAICQEKEIRIISGDPLNGKKVTYSDFMHYGHTAVTLIEEYIAADREFFHFLRLGKNKFTASKAYSSGHVKWKKPYRWIFDTNMHGEERSFIDGSIYERVTPMNIFPMQLVKAIMADDYERAIEYGLLEVVCEDFSVCEFICPSKAPMMSIVEQGLQKAWYTSVIEKKSFPL